jgi:hypothetical protein
MVRVIEVLVLFWTELNEPSRFADDPVGAAGNQGTHILIGGSAAVAVCVVWAYFYGEMPYRWPLWVAIVLLYAGFVEWFFQGWKRRDSVVDTYFISLGAAGPLVALKEVEYRPEIQLEFNAAQCLTWLVVLVMSMALYVYPRAAQKYKGDEK